MKALVWYGAYLKKNGAYEAYVQNFKSVAAPTHAQVPLDIKIKKK